MNSIFRFWASFSTHYVFIMSSYFYIINIRFLLGYLNTQGMARRCCLRGCRYPILMFLVSCFQVWVPILFYTWSLSVVLVVFFLHSVFTAQSGWYHCSDVTIDIFLILVSCKPYMHTGMPHVINSAKLFHTTFQRVLRYNYITDVTIGSTFFLKHITHILWWA